MQVLETRAGSLLQVRIGVVSELCQILHETRVEHRHLLTRIEQLRCGVNSVVESALVRFGVR
jgi:hypothetical protein